MSEHNTVHEAGREVGQAVGEVASEWLPVVAEFLGGILDGITPMMGTILADLWDVGMVAWDFGWAVVGGMMDGMGEASAASDG